ncbi:hypothetical protein AB0L65_08170 [Nonomuraea sp. NPDC052116]|uniref:hypothetical protein n=1 Tax=Nonomuraea sp. NPDC052116 TaxID=3155665 RepID=UPI003415A6A6
MRPRVKPALRRIIRDKHTLQYGAHPLRAVMLSGLTEAVRQWIESLDGTRDLECVLSDAAAAGLDEIRARSLLDQLAAQGALHDAATSPAPIADLSLAERDRLRPDLDALDLASTAPDGAIGLIARRRERRVRVYGAGRVGAQVAALLAASGVGTIRILDPATARPCDITPGGLTWAEVGLPREVGAAMVARRLTSGGPTPTAQRSPAASAATAPPIPLHTATSQPTATAPPQPTVGTATAQPIATTVPPQTTVGTTTAQPMAATGANPPQATGTTTPQPIATTGTNPAQPTASAGSTRASENPRATANSRGAEGTPTAQPSHPQRPQAGKGPRTTRATQGTRIPQTEEDGRITWARENTRSARTTAGAQPIGSAPSTRTTEGAQPTSPAPSARTMKSGQPTSPAPPTRTTNGAQPTSSARTAAVPAEVGSRWDGLEHEDGENVRRPSVNAMAGGPYLGDQSDRPDLVILAPVAPLDGVMVNELTALGIPHLLASAFEGHGTVGPLVLPGKTACLHCLDLTRRDRDPMWPIVTARLGGYPPGEIACDVTLAALVAAAVAGHALAYLDGRESAVTNGTMDVTPDWRWKRRSWTIHPQCRCMRNNPYSLRMVMSPNRD